jgi:hypothetical protein
MVGAGRIRMLGYYKQSNATNKNNFYCYGLAAFGKKYHYATQEALHVSDEPFV